MIPSWIMLECEESKFGLLRIRHDLVNICGINTPFTFIISLSRNFGSYGCIIHPNIDRVI